MKQKIKHFVKIHNLKYLHIHDIQIASAAIQISEDLDLKFTLDLHENRPEIMKYYKHVNSFLESLLINPRRWKVAEENFIKKAGKANNCYQRGQKRAY